MDLLNREPATELPQQQFICDEYIKVIHQLSIVLASKVDVNNIPCDAIKFFSIYTLISPQLQINLPHFTTHLGDNRSKSLASHLYMVHIIIQY